MKIPKLTMLGLFDIKLKHGNVAITEKRLVHSYEIELPIDDGGYSYINDKEHRIKKNKLICAKPGQIRQTKPPFCCYYIHLIPDNGTVCNALNELPDIITLSEPEKYYALFEEIIAEYNSNAHTETFAVLGKILILIDMLKKENGLNVQKNTVRQKANIGAIETAIEYIDNNFTQKLTLEELSQKVFLSSVYFRNLFYDTVGISPYEYILDKRIELAKHLLTATEMPISEISESCGFSGQAYFGSVFKSHTGYTPRGFRIRINNLYP